MSNPILIDFETFYDARPDHSDYGIRELGTWRYCNDERFDPYLISACDGEDSWVGEPKDFNWDCLNGQTVLAHNALFERSVISAGEEKGIFPKITPKEWHCTANMSACLSNRRALKDASKFLLGVNVEKDVRDRANGKTSAQMKAEGWWPDMLKYGRADSVLAHQLWTKHSGRWTTFERRLSDLTIRQCKRGVQIDVPKLQRYREFIHEAVKRMENAIPWVRDGIAGPKGRKALAEQCRKDNIPCPPIKSHQGGEEAYTKWYADYAPKISWIRALSDYFSVVMLHETLEKINTRTRPDGVMPFGLKYFGAHTGRWSGDAGINLQNLRKESYYFDEVRMLCTDESRLIEIAGTLAATGSPPEWVSFVVDLRSLIIPRPGKRMILSDLSQIEPRVLAWLVGDKSMLAKMAAGQSPYQAHAEATMGWNRGDFKALIKAGDLNAKELYALAKARVIGLGYQCGWEKFITVALIMAGLDVTKNDPKEIQETIEMDGEITPVFNKDGSPKMVSGWGMNSRRIVKDYRAQNPLIADKEKGIWGQLDRAFKSSAGGDFEMELPSGRKMIYRNVRREVSVVYNEETEKYERKFVTKAEVVKNGVVARQPLYGGILTENLDQATSRDIFGEQQLELDTMPGCDVLFSSHDEAICEVDERVSEKDVDRVMSRTPEWIAGLPVAAESRFAPHYLK